jgi:hypothetical protein
MKKRRSATGGLQRNPELVHDHFKNFSIYKNMNVSLLKKKRAFGKEESTTSG